MASQWQRPDSVPFPTVWSLYNGRKPLGNGAVPKFRIQDMSEELVEPAIEHMLSCFVRDEPLCEHLGFFYDEESRQEMTAIWREVAKSRLGLIAIVDNYDDLDDQSLPRVAGANFTFPLFPDSKDPELKSPTLRSVLNFVNQISHGVDCFKKYNVPVYMYAFGLSVDPTFRGNGLGEELLKARFPLCRAVGIPLTVTVFTGALSQSAARKAGFELLAEQTLDQYSEGGKLIFVGARTKSIQLMAAKVPLL